MNEFIFESTISDFFIFLADDCSDDYIEEQAKHWLEKVYSPTNFEYNINATQKSWEYNTNINDETSAAKVNVHRFHENS